jgi:phosphoenolpyruvate carboxykinase (diphosphate)
VKQDRDIALWRRHLAALQDFRKKDSFESGPIPFDASARTEWTQAQLDRATAPSYLSELRGTIGADPFDGQPKA